MLTVQDFPNNEADASDESHLENVDLGTKRLLPPVGADDGVAEPLDGFQVDWLAGAVTGLNKEKSKKLKLSEQVFFGRLLSAHLYAEFPKS